MLCPAFMFRSGHDWRAFGERLSARLTSTPFQFLLFLLPPFTKQDLGVYDGAATVPRPFYKAGLHYDWVAGSASCGQGAWWCDRGVALGDSWISPTDFLAAWGPFLATWSLLDGGALLNVTTIAADAEVKGRALLRAASTFLLGRRGHGEARMRGRRNETDGGRGGRAGGSGGGGRGEAE